MDDMWTDAMSDDFHQWVEADIKFSNGTITKAELDAANAKWNASAGFKFIWNSVKLPK